MQPIKSAAMATLAMGVAGAPALSFGHQPESVAQASPVCFNVDMLCRGPPPFSPAQPGILASPLLTCSAGPTYTPSLSPMPVLPAPKGTLGCPTLLASASCSSWLCRLL